MNNRFARADSGNDSVRLRVCLLLRCNAVARQTQKPRRRPRQPSSPTWMPTTSKSIIRSSFRSQRRPSIKPLLHSNVTGVVQPDIARAVPVVSLATGRVVEIKARLGDEVKKGQLLLRVQSNDVSGAYQNYLKAVNDERLAQLQLDRAQLLYDKGAIAKSALESAAGRRRRCQGRSRMLPPNSCVCSGVTRIIPPASSMSSRPSPA